MAGVNLDLIKQEIDSRKSEKAQISEQAGHVPADQFLSQLKKSLFTGEPTLASTKLQVVTERSDNMAVTGGQIINKNTAPINPQILQEMSQTATPNYNQNVNQNYNQTVNPNPNPGATPNMNDPREQQFYQNLQETKQILGNGAPNQNVGMADALAMYTNQGQGQQQMITNPNALNEAVKAEVVNFMSNLDINALIEQAVKTTMMEMYQKEKVETALNENKDLIGTIVVDTIMELRKKQNSKKTTK